MSICIKIENIFLCSCEKKCFSDYIIGDYLPVCMCQLLVTKPVSEMMVIQIKNVLIQFITFCKCLCETLQSQPKLVSTIHSNAQSKEEFYILVILYTTINNCQCYGTFKEE